MPAAAAQGRGPARHRATELLKRSRRSIKQVAAAVGFATRRALRGRSSGPGADAGRGCGGSGQAPGARRPVQPSTQASRHPRRNVRFVKHAGVAGHQWNSNQAAAPESQICEGELVRIARGSRRANSVRYAVGAARARSTMSTNWSQASSSGPVAIDRLLDIPVGEFPGTTPFTTRVEVRLPILSPAVSRSRRRHSAAARPGISRGEQQFHS